VKLNFTDFEAASNLLAESIAQHDAILLAWKEKTRHDLVRPPAIIRRLRAGKMVKAFVSSVEGVKDVKAEEWEPLFPVQGRSAAQLARFRLRCVKRG
jgi:hypothetical protein